MKEKVTIGRIWGVLYPIIYYFAISMAFSMAITVVLEVVLLIENRGSGNVSRVVEDLLQSTYEHLLLITLIVNLIALPLLIYFRYRDIQKDKMNYKHKSFEQVLFTKYFLIIPFGICFMLSANALVSILAMYMPKSMTESYSELSKYLFYGDLSFQLFTVAVIGPIAEEMIYRALVYNRIKKMGGVVVGAVLSSLIFGIAHGNWIQAPYAFLVGLGCVFVYEKYKSIAAPMLLHMSANAFSVFVTAVAGSAEAQNVDQIPKMNLLIETSVVMLVTGLFAVGLGIIINKIVNPKELS